MLQAQEATVLHLNFLGVREFAVNRDDFECELGILAQQLYELATAFVRRSCVAGNAFPVGEIESSRTHTGTASTEDRFFEHAPAFVNLFVCAAVLVFFNHG